MARVMGAYQQGTTTLQRLRSGGQQTVVVQHVQVNDGGQAIVAGKVKAGGTRKRAGGVEAKNDRCTSGTRLATSSR
jgi:hypothetical protein